MNLIINDLPCEASTGQKIGKAARLNHSHVGYVCGGHGICQACYVTVKEGSECLSPLSDIEKAFLSERQIMSGGRLACQATIEREGTVTVLSRPEEVRRLLFRNPVSLFAYGAVMGQDTASRILPGITNLAGRISRGEMNGKDLPADLLESAGAALKLALTTLPTMIPFMEQLSGLACKLPFSPPLLCASSTIDTPEPLLLKVTFPAVQPVIVTVTESAPVAETPAVEVISVVEVISAAEETPAIEEIPSVVDVASLEGIKEEHALKLIKADVKSFDTLLERGRDKNGRKELASATGMVESTILTLVNRADLARVKGIGFIWSELLEAAGVDTIPELAQRNSSNLYAKLQAINKQKKLAQQLPSVDQVKAWIEQAKKLPRIIIY